MSSGFYIASGDTDIYAM